MSANISVLFVERAPPDYFPQPSGSSECKPCWPSKTSALEAHFPHAGPLGWGPQCGAWARHSLRRTSAIVIILLSVGCPPRGMGVDYITSLFFLPSHCGSFFISLAVEDLFC